MKFECYCGMTVDINTIEDIEVACKRGWRHQQGGYECPDCGHKTTASKMVKDYTWLAPKIVEPHSEEE